MSSPRKPQLNAGQRARVEQARALETAEPETLSAGYEHINPDDLAQVYGYAFGAARATVRELLLVIGELTGGAR